MGPIVRAVECEKEPEPVPVTCARSSAWSRGNNQRGAMQRDVPAEERGRQRGCCRSEARWAAPADVLANGPRRHGSAVHDDTRDHCSRRRNAFAQGRTARAAGARGGRVARDVPASMTLLPGLMSSQDVTKAMSAR